MLFFSRGTRVKQWPMPQLGDTTFLVLRYSYFAIMFIFSFTWGDEWYLISDKRSEDRKLTKPEVDALFQPNKPPNISLWEQFSLVGVAALLGILVGIAPLLS